MKLVRHWLLLVLSCNSHLIPNVYIRADALGAPALFSPIDGIYPDRYTEKRVIMKGRGDPMQVIEENYSTFTPMEKRIADHFLEETVDGKTDLSAKTIATKLYVSEAALSRFAKKCGYKGYREFIFDYRRDKEKDHAKEHLSRMTRRVRDTYDMLMEENFRHLDEGEIRHAVDLMNKHKRVLVCGMGSSGYAAMEFQMRFMCLGMDITA
ncbi:MAG: MurR/RpiR family transcriptional regulator, partial [Lachnospiraceae bacterium]|nr:MurR/RpiR family transcriptional regulator [Lachnospiraceae bacterium]